MAENSGDTAGGMIAALDRRLIPVENLFNLMSGLFIFGLMILGIMPVVGRQVFNIPVSGYIDWVEVSMAVFAFMGAAYCQRTGTHVRMELFLSKMGLRTRWSATQMPRVIPISSSLKVPKFWWKRPGCGQILDSPPAMAASIFTASPAQTNTQRL